MLANGNFSLSSGYYRRFRNKLSRFFLFVCSSGVDIRIIKWLTIEFSKVTEDWSHTEDGAEALGGGDEKGGAERFARSVKLRYLNLEHTRHAQALCACQLF